MKCQDQNEVLPEKWRPTPHELHASVSEMYKWMCNSVFKCSDSFMRRQDQNFATQLFSQGDSLIVQ